MLAASSLVCLVTGLMSLVCFWCQSRWLVQPSIICLGWDKASGEFPADLASPWLPPVSYYWVSCCLWSSCWPEVSLPGPTLGSSCIAMGTWWLNSAAILPRNSQWFSQTKLRASLYLTTLQELSLAKAQVGGSLRIRKILPRVPKSNNKWLLLLVRLSTYLIYLLLLCT